MTKRDDYYWWLTHREFTLIIEEIRYSLRVKGVRCTFGIHTPYMYWSNYYGDYHWGCVRCGEDSKEPLRNRILDKIIESLYEKFYIREGRQAMTPIYPTLYVRHPDGSYTEAEPQSENHTTLALRQARAIIDTLPPTTGHRAVSRIAVLDVLDDAIRHAQGPNFYEDR